MSEQPQAAQEWVRPGARVLVRNRRGLAGRGVVAKVGKRDVVLEDGARFSVRSLHNYGAWDTSWLVDPESEEGARLILRAQHRRLVNRVRLAWQEVEEHGGRGTGRVGELIACATELRDWLQQEEDARRG